MVSSRCGDKFMRVGIFSVCGHQQNWNVSIISAMIMAERPPPPLPCKSELLRGSHVFTRARGLHVEEGRAHLTC